MTWAKAAALSLLAVLLPVRPLVVASMALVLLDTFSGILAARKRGERVTSAGLRRSVAKCLMYTTAILAAFVAERWLLDGLLPVSKLVAGAIGIVELKSCLENLDTASGGSLFRSILARLSSPNDKGKE